MINAKLGDTMIRITPPRNGREGYAQYGTVSEVSDEKITIMVQVDIQRHMEFRREDGMDTNGIGSFIVRAHA